MEERWILKVGVWKELWFWRKVAKEEEREEDFFFFKTLDQNLWKNHYGHRKSNYKKLQNLISQTFLNRLMIRNCAVTHYPLCNFSENKSEEIRGCVKSRTLRSPHHPIWQWINLPLTSDPAAQEQFECHVAPPDGPETMKGRHLPTLQVCLLDCPSWLHLTVFPRPKTLSSLQTNEAITSLAKPKPNTIRKIDLEVSNV